MAINTYRFWMATDSNRLLANQNSFIQANPPAFYQGNVANLELYMVASAGVGVTPVDVPFPAGAEISVAVGDTNAYPTGGSWELSVDSVETGPMPYNATTAQVAAALNALASVSAAGGVSVAKTGEGYTITWNTYGLKPTIGIGSDTLTPSSYESISLVQTGSSQNRQIVFVELRQNPIALSNVWTPLPTPSITSTLVKAWDGSSVIWRVTIYPQPKAGTMTLSYGTKTATIDVASSAATIAIALEAQVFATGQYQWDIVLAEDSTLTASGNLIGYNGYSGTINFATAECHQFLAGDEGRNTTIEVSISVDDKRYTLIQTACAIFADVISDGVLTPLPLGVALSEQVANARFVRRDIDQAPDTATQNVIWQNLGVETLGSDIVGALNGADSPSAANPFATISDIPSVTQAEWGNIVGTLSNQSDLASELNFLNSSKYDVTNPAGYIDGSALAGYATESWVWGQGYTTEAWVQSQNYVVSGQTNPTFDSSLSLTSINGGSAIFAIAGSSINSDPGFYGSNAISFSPDTGYSHSLATYPTFPSAEVSALNGLKLVNSSNQTIVYDGQLTYNGVEPYARKDGTTFTNKVSFTSVNGVPGLNIGIGATSNNSVVPGDLWISTGGTNLNFRDGTGSWRILVNTSNTNTFSSPQIIDTTATTPALRVTQKGTGNVLLVEDAINPDASALVVEQNGNVGIGVATGYTATSKVEVVGNVKADTFSNGAGPTFAVTSTAAHTGGTDTLDLLVTINGTSYRIGLRPA